MAKEIKVEGQHYADEIKRFKALEKINTLTTDELEKLGKMCTDRGRKMLKSKWTLIKSFI